MSDAEQAGIDGLHAEIADLHAKLEAAEGRIEQARERLREGAFIYYSLEHRAEVFRLRAMDARTILTEPANAEGIASEGGSADWQPLAGELAEESLARYWDGRRRSSRTDAPSAEAGPIKGVGPIESEMGSDSRWETGPDPLAEPSPTGGGAGESWRDDAQAQALIEAIHEPAQPDWQALAGELANALLLAAHSQATEAVVVMGAEQALARYDEATAQHSGDS